MTDISKICDELGRSEIAKRLGKKGIQPVSNAISSGAFPPRWSAVIRKMCEERGMDCPDRLFAFDRDAAEVAAE